MEGELQVDEPSEARFWLFCFDDGYPFAYARRREFVRCSDGRPWAYKFNDRLISVRSGQCLAVRVGNVYYDRTTGDPAYYERL